MKKFQWSKGRYSIVEVGMDDNIILRNVKLDDLGTTFRWASDESIRENSFNTGIISYDEHRSWFLNKIKYNNFYYILEKDKEPVGQIRLESVDGYWLLSYNIDGLYRGKGYGSKMIQLLEGVIGKHNKKYIIVAYVKISNNTSINILRKLGYNEILLDNIYKFWKQVGE